MKKGNKWGYIDKNGKLVIGYNLDSAPEFTSNSLTPYFGHGQWGYINKKGKVVIDCQYDQANPFINGKALVRFRKYISAAYDGIKYSIINEKGKIVQDAVNKKDFLYMIDSSSPWDYSIQNNKKYLTYNGKEILEYQFDDYRYPSSNGFLWVKKDGKWGCIKLTTKTINDRIEDFINSEMALWQKKGKYETTQSYLERLGEENRKKQFELLLNTAITKLTAIYCDWKAINSEYDPDNQIFKIKVKGLDPMLIKVPVDEAKDFDASIKELKFSNIAYSLGSNGNFYIKKASIENPFNSKIYNYSSDDKAMFTYSQFNVNLDPININLKENHSNQQVQNENKIVNVGLSDIDVNIPINHQTSSNTFVIIIANENYQKEAKVQFAVNDGKVFKEYCEKTLGIPAKNIHFAPDATFGSMKSEIKWISDVASAYSGKARLIFYYAGHGMPNEADKSAYILPVDGFSTDFESAIKLSDLYNRLAFYPSQNITVFLDACFSGSVRDNGMLANARGVKIKPISEVIKGNMIVFSAATGDETAYPYKEKQHGLFTYFLLKKLQETKGEINYQNLSGYIIENVKQQSIVVNQKSQTPQVNTSIELQSTWQNLKLK